MKKLLRTSRHILVKWLGFKDKEIILWVPSQKLNCFTMGQVSHWHRAVVLLNSNIQHHRRAKGHLRGTQGSFYPPLAKLRRFISLSGFTSINIDILDKFQWIPALSFNITRQIYLIPVFIRADPLVKWHLTTVYRYPWIDS